MGSERDHMLGVRILFRKREEGKQEGKKKSEKEGKTGKVAGWPFSLSFLRARPAGRLLRTCLSI